MRKPPLTAHEKLQRSPQEVARWQKAQQQLLAGRHGPALAGYRDLVKRWPTVAQLWFEMGVAAGGDLDFTLADQAFRRAMELAPEDASLLILMGQHYHRFRNMAQATACFERAVAADPTSAQARNSLAAWFERERRLSEAQECVDACLAQNPQDGQARYLRALLLQRQGRNTEAETSVRDLLKNGLLDPQVKSSSLHLLGIVMNELGQYGEALRWIEESKLELRKLTDTSKLEQEYDQANQYRRAFMATLTSDAVKRWQQEAPVDPRPWRLAFLGGHPRSGTTLLEQVLGAHPEVRAFDEAEAFVLEVLTPVVPSPATTGLTMETMESLTSGWRANLSRRYFKSLLREVEGEPSARVLLDKNPSPTASLPLWLRLFPGLKVIVALRDPRDVIISCYFQNLALTTINVNFMSLERTVQHYTALMDVWLRMRDLGGFDWIETRYEDIVNNLEAEGRRVTEFLGLAWRQEQASFHESASQKVIFAPNYESVGKPVHKRAVGRWERYAEALAPLQERLAPYCRAFGY
ncbi:MAG TPA: sulfotransferase [Verrucomicrobiae bacterium]|jgi:tetratricopeptide (TPR) repeat protein|nr:sulfotransferase [Verrucomicrobiae bacterium]